MTFFIMLTAAHTGTPPQRIREEWSWRDVEQFVECLPGIRAYGHPLFSGGQSQTDGGS